jgi:hypothetical protein
MKHQRVPAADGARLDGNVAGDRLIGDLQDE